MIRYLPGPGISQDARRAFESRLAALRPTRRARAYRPRPDAVEAAGARALAAVRAPVPESARYVVRAFYASAGGETLCFEYPAAVARVRDANEAEARRAGMEHETLTLDASHSERSRRWCRYRCDGPDTRNARLVVLPSQINEDDLAHSDAWRIARARLVFAEAACERSAA